MYIAKTCEKCYPLRDTTEQNALTSWLKSCNLINFKED